MQRLVEIVAISVDDRQATLYHRDGTITTLEQGDKRLPPIVKTAKEEIPEQGWCIVDIGEEIPKREEFNDVEKGTKGLIKFFKVAKSKVVDFFSDSPTKVDEKVAHIRPIDVGVKPGEKVELVTDELPVPVTTKAATNTEKAELVLTDKVEATPVVSNDQKLDAARERMNELLVNSHNTESPEFHKRLRDDETIVAVNTETGSILPEAQKLASQFKVASKLQNYKGVENFIKRLEPVLKDRGHSASDLMKFLEKGDLPIADDGCIVIFKRLEKQGSTLVDCHTGKVRQNVGSFVFMRAGLVDPNRRQDCSNGLHVASLGYLSSFGGSQTIIGKVRPEDVFAVPEYNTRKMRVCGYHILGILPPEVRNAVNRGQPITSVPEGQVILENVLRGNHCGVSQHVEIRGQHGTDIVYTDIVDSKASISLDTAVDNISAEVLDTSLDTKGEVRVDMVTEAPVKATDLVTDKPVVKDAPVQAKQATNRSSLMGSIFDEMVEAFASDFPEKAARLAQQLVDAKKKAKKSWKALGFDEGDQTAINDCLAHKAEAPLVPKATVAKDASTSYKTAVAKEAKPMTVNQQAQHLYQVFKDTKKLGNRENTKDAAQELQFFMSSRKKGPKAFGLDTKVSEELKTWLK